MARDSLAQVFKTRIGRPTRSPAFGRPGSKWSAILSVGLLLGIALGAAAQTPSPAALAIPQTVEGSPAPSLLVPSDFFTENAGQVANPEVLYYARGGGVSIGFAPGAVLVNLQERQPKHDIDLRAGPMLAAPIAPSEPAPPLRGHLVRIAFEGANPVLPQGRGELPHRANFFLGNDPARWHTNVRNYAEVVYENVWDGIDVVYGTSPEGVKYDLVFHPGADLEDAAFVYEGVTNLEVTYRALSVETDLGPLRDDLPAAWQASGLPIACAFQQIAERTVGYACSGWDETGDLVVDPLLYSTFLGGTGFDWGLANTVDASGVAYVTGVTADDATDFPTTPGAYNATNNGAQDTFVAKLNANGSSLLYSTFLGGSGDDAAYGIAVEASGAAFVTGITVDDITDFPTTPGAYDTTHNGGAYDAFVAKLNANGSSLLYSTFLGGSGFDQGYRIAVDASGAAYVTGGTQDAAFGFPTTPGAYDRTHNGGVADAFVAKLNANGSSLLYSTFLGGGAGDGGLGIAVDVSGAAYVTGYTEDNVTNFPTTPGAYDTTHSGGLYDAFVAKLNANGSSLLYSTFLGGSGIDSGYDVAVDVSGAAYVTGYTEDNVTNFPTTPGAYDTTHNGGLYDAFVAKLNASGSSLLYSTFLGGSGDDGSYGIAIDAAGAAYVTGYTEDNVTNFPTTPGAYDTTHNGGVADAFVAKLNANGSSLLYSTFLGGGAGDGGFGIAVDVFGAAYVTGGTKDNVTNFPTTPGAYDTTHNGGLYDAFVAKLDFLSTPLLSATGEPNYATDGVDPEAGTLADLYTYRVNYTDWDSDTPLAGDPKVHILKGGVEVSGSPFSTTEVDTLDTSVMDGKWYAYTTTLASRGTDYSYYFTANDTTGLAAADWPASPADAPDVLDSPPTADTGVDQTGVFRNATVALNGTASSDPDGDPLTYSWVQVAGPAVTLNNASSSIADSSPAALGFYTFQLTVDDGFGGNSSDTVTVTVVNQPPAADAGPDQPGRFRNVAVTLDGMASRDADGDLLTFSWAQTAGPAIALTGANTPSPSFTPTAPGTYGFRLTVNDVFGGNSTDDVTVTVVNREPTADAGAAQTVRVGDLVTLNGTASTDPDGDVLAYSWTASPSGVTLSSDAAAAPTFTPTTGGTWTFTLRVDDGNGGNDTDTVTITVEAPPVQPPTDNTLLYVAAGIALLVLLILLALLAIRKKKKQAEEEMNEPAGQDKAKDQT